MTHHQVSFSPPHLRKAAVQALYHLCSTPHIAATAVDLGLLEPLVVSCPDEPPVPARRRSLLGTPAGAAQQQPASASSTAGAAAGVPDSSAAGAAAPGAAQPLRAGDSFCSTSSMSSSSATAAGGSSISAAAAGGSSVIAPCAVSSIDRAFVSLIARIIHAAPSTRTEALKVGCLDRLLTVAQLVSDGSPWTSEDRTLLATCLAAAVRARHLSPGFLFPDLCFGGEKPGLSRLRTFFPAWWGRGTLRLRCWRLQAPPLQRPANRWSLPGRSRERQSCPRRCFPRT